MRYWRPWTAFALGWWLGRLLGLVVASWRLTRWLRRNAHRVRVAEAEEKIASVKIERDVPDG